MRLGVCYYPEHWPENRWAEDAALMQAAGIEIVRLAEFAWSRLEPADGAYDWAWLDRAIACFVDHDCQIVLGTPTATPPIWLTRAHPEILRVDREGRARAHGTRRHYDPNSAIYRDYCDRIVAAMVDRYGAHPAVVGWQIDNEFGGGSSGRSYGPPSAAAFQTWLAERYGTIDALNAAWGTAFWSQAYAAFDQVDPPHRGIDKPNPSHVLDFYRFSSDSWVDFQQRQVDPLRSIERADGGPFITHNFMGLFRDIDQFALAETLDFVTWDNYPTANPDRWREQLTAARASTTQMGEEVPFYAYDVGDPVVTGMAHALTYGLKQAPFWVMEQQNGFVNWGDINPGVRPGTPRLWVWHAVAEGANTIVFFRWRAAVVAQEQYHSGLLKHDGTPDIGYRDLLRLQEERAALDRLAAAPNDAEVALLVRYDDLWALELQPHRAGFDYFGLHFLYYEALRGLGVNVHLVGESADLSRYKLVIAPTLHVVSAETVAKLEAYARAGGTLLLGIRSGFKTIENQVTTEPLPGPLRELTGITVDSWQSLPDGIEWELAPLIPYLKGSAGAWVEELVPQSEAVEVLVRYRDQRSVAMTDHAVGEGHVLYLGWYPIPDDMEELMSYMAWRLKIRTISGLPLGVVVQRRGEQTVLLNFSDQLQTMRLNGKPVAIGPRDVAVLG